jgi:hypothetical protein
MNKTTILLVIGAFLLGYWLSAKVAASFVGKFLSPLSS